MDSNGLPLKCYMIFLSYFQYFENNNILFYPLFCVTHVYQDCHEYQVLINVFFCLGCQEIKKPFWGTRSSTLGSFDMSFPFTYIAEDFQLKLTKPSIYLMATNYMINKRYFTKFFCCMKLSKYYMQMYLAFTATVVSFDRFLLAVE